MDVPGMCKTETDAEEEISYLHISESVIYNSKFSYTKTTPLSAR